MIKPAPRKRVVLFVDTGDNCRCPMAKEYLKMLLAARNITWIEIETAGVMTPNGLLPTPEAVQMIRDERGDAETMAKQHLSRPLKAELIARADIILGMTPFHVQSAYRISEAARGKTFLLKEYTGQEGRNVQIPDPMGGTLEIYKKVFGQIKACLHKLVEMDIITKCPYPQELVQAAPSEQTADEVDEVTAEEAVEPGLAKAKSAPKVGSAVRTPAKSAAKTAAKPEFKPLKKKPAKPETTKKPKPATKAKATKNSKAEPEAKPKAPPKTKAAAKPKRAAKAKPAAKPKAEVQPLPKKAKALVKAKTRRAAKAAAKPKTKPVTKKTKPVAKAAASKPVKSARHQAKKTTKTTKRR